jgi:hypothetical protein
MFQKFVKCSQFVRKSVLPPKIIHASDFVNAIINPRRTVRGMTSHSFCNVVASDLLTLFSLRFTCPEDGGDTFFRNVGSNHNYTAPNPRRRLSS